MEGEGSGKGQPTLSFSFLPAFPSFGKGWCKMLPAGGNILPWSAEQIPPPGAGSRGVKVGGCARSPLPSPAATIAPSRMQPRRRGLLFYLVLMLEDQLAPPTPFLFFSFPVLPALGAKPHSSASIANSVGRELASTCT